MSDSEHPELAGFEPGDGRPLRSARTLKVMRIVVVLGLVGLILPSIVITVQTASRTARVACQIVVANTSTEAVGAKERFELTGPAGPGWYCYQVEFGGHETLLRSLGLIPELQRVPVPSGGQNS